MHGLRSTQLPQPHAHGVEGCSKRQYAIYTLTWRCMVFDARNFHNHMRMELKAAPHTRTHTEPICVHVHLKGTQYTLTWRCLVYDARRQYAIYTLTWRCMVFEARNFHNHIRMELKAAPSRPAITKLTSKKGNCMSLRRGQSIQEGMCVCVCVCVCVSKAVA